MVIEPMISERPFGLTCALYCSPFQGTLSSSAPHVIIIVPTSSEHGRHHLLWTILEEKLAYYVVQTLNRVTFDLLSPRSKDHIKGQYYLLSSTWTDHDEDAIVIDATYASKMQN